MVKNTGDDPTTDRISELLNPAPPPVETLGGKLRTWFFTGIIVTAPILLTAYILLQVINSVDASMALLLPDHYRDAVEAMVPENYRSTYEFLVKIPGLGVLVAVASFTLIGAIAANFIGQKLTQWSDRALNRIPVVRSLYSAFKQLFETMLGKSASSFRECVLIEYPRRGIYTIAFVTSRSRGEVQRRTHNDMIAVFVPTTPNPTSGFLLYVPAQDCIPLSMSVEEGLKLVISTGLIMPAESPAEAQPKSDDDLAAPPRYLAG